MSLALSPALRRNEAHALRGNLLAGEQSHSTTKSSQAKHAAYSIISPSDRPSSLERRQYSELFKA
jgi:hypothetical protein